MSGQLETIEGDEIMAWIIVEGRIEHLSLLAVACVFLKRDASLKRELTECGWPCRLPELWGGKVNKQSLPGYCISFRHGREHRTLSVSQLLYFHKRSCWTRLYVGVALDSIIFVKSRQIQLALLAHCSLNFLLNQISKAQLQRCLGGERNQTISANEGRHVRRLLLLVATKLITDCVLWL